MSAYEQDTSARGARPASLRGAAPTLVAPFPYFGGKRHAASTVWRLLGDPGAYVEPFAGSAAVLLARPDGTGRKRREILNDLDGWLSNMWRAVRDQPDEVVAHLGGPITEIDIHARQAWLNEHRTPDLIAHLEGDPTWCDPRAAAWWLYTVLGSISGTWQPGPWRTHGGRMMIGPRGSTDGIQRVIPHLTRGHPMGPARDLTTLSARMQDVVITCGDWRRPLTTALDHNGTVGVFLDPPYASRSEISPHSDALYIHDGLQIGGQVADWCLTAPEPWRIVLCGYDDEHDQLLSHGWTKHLPPRSGAGGGYRKTKPGDPHNGVRDRLWASPACLPIHSEPTLFDEELA